MKSCELGLLLVDIQRDFWRPLAGLPEFAAFPGNIRTLLRVARASKMPIVHTQAVFQPDGSDWMLFYRARGTIPCIAGTEGARIEDFAAPLPGEAVIAKQSFDGFAGTDLERTLRAGGIRALLVAGLETSVCVLFTATSAYARRIVPLVVTDACADVPERHAGALGMYAGLCFQTVTTPKVDDLSGVLHLAEQHFDRTPASPRQVP